MGGPAYVPERGNRSVFRFPNYYAGKPLFYEWSRDYIKEIRLSENQRPSGIFPFNAFVDNPMDMEFGPDGALYVIEYGDGFFAENPDAQLSKINFVQRQPDAGRQGRGDDPTGGRAPLTVTFSSAGTDDPDKDELSFAWDFDGDGDVDSRAANPTHTYTRNGTFRPTLKVTDQTKRSASAEALVLVGNQPPVVTLKTTPSPDAPFTFGGTVTYEVTVTDDTPVDCTQGHGRVRARPRAARPPAVLGRGLHGLVRDPGGHRPRRRLEPERGVRRVLHRPRRGRPARPDRHRPGQARAARETTSPALQLDRRRGGPGIRPGPRGQLQRPRPQRRPRQRPPDREPHAARRAEPRREPHADARPVDARGVLGHVPARRADEHRAA